MNDRERRVTAQNAVATTISSSISVGCRTGDATSEAAAAHRRAGGPARNSTPLPGGANEKGARTSAPFVTSGSSLASLTMLAVAHVPVDCLRQGEGHALATRQDDMNGIRKLPAQQRDIGCLGSCVRAGTRRPSPTQRTFLLHDGRYMGHSACCHRSGQPR